MCDNAIVESVCCSVGCQEPCSTEPEETLDTPTVLHSLCFLSVFVFMQILSRARTHFCLKHYFTFICCVCVHVCGWHTSVDKEKLVPLSYHAGSKDRLGSSGLLEFTFTHQPSLSWAPLLLWKHKFHKCVIWYLEK